MRYFNPLPTIKYGPNNVLVRDITRRSAFVKNNLNDPKLFQPYTIEEGQTIESIAYFYYGSVDDAWIIALANDIIDPYEDWPMEYETFTNYMVEKYEELSGTTGVSVVDWTQNETIANNIVYYYRQNEDNETIDKCGPNTFTHLTGENSDGWQPRRIYDEEYSLNETKRLIRIINRDYKQKVISEFKKLMSRDY